MSNQMWLSVILAVSSGAVATALTYWQIRTMRRLSNSSMGETNRSAWRVFWAVFGLVGAVAGLVSCIFAFVAALLDPDPIVTKGVVFKMSLGASGAMFFVALILLFVIVLIDAVRYR